MTEGWIGTVVWKPIWISSQWVVWQKQMFVWCCVSGRWSGHVLWCPIGEQLLHLRIYGMNVGWGTRQFEGEEELCIHESSKLCCCEAEWPFTSTTLKPWGSPSMWGRFGHNGDWKNAWMLKLGLPLFCCAALVLSAHASAESCIHTCGNKCVTQFHALYSSGLSTSIFIIWILQPDGCVIHPLGELL